MHHHDDHQLTPEELADVRRRGDAELRRLGYSRRAILRAGMAATAASAIPGAVLTFSARRATADDGPQPVNPDQLLWLVGDHHVHTQYSHDAKYRIKDQLDAAEHFGVDWIVFTEHSNFQHADPGVFNSLAEIKAERAARPDILIFQGIEWYIPAAEHCTVMVTGEREAEILRAFELVYDGKLNGWEKPPVGSEDEAFQEQKAAEAIAWLGQQKRDGAIDDALIIANHPMRLGIDSPDEFRLWNDADPHIMIGMEGAPGAQGYPYGRNVGYGDQRGEYVNEPRADSYPGYTVEHMRTYGGWDWMTATVGGFWDSMLAEGRRFFVTANSDAHLAAWHTWRLGDYPDTPEYRDAGSEHEQMRLLGGRRPHPIDTDTGEVAGDLLISNGDGSTTISGDLIRSEVHAQRYRDAERIRAEIDADTPGGQSPQYPHPLIETQGGSDFWPGQFTRIHAGATDRSYPAVMAALRAGRVWADHGRLLDAFIVKVSADGTDAVTLGGTLTAPKGSTVTVEMTITAASRPVRSIAMSADDPDATDPTRAAEWVPELAFVDIIGGPITGTAEDRETVHAPHTRVLRSFDTGGRTGTYTLTHIFDDVQDSFYIRFRGSDGNRHGVGYHGVEVDPRGPIMHSDDPRAGNPWIDTWFYANPVFVEVGPPVPSPDVPSTSPSPTAPPPSPTPVPTAEGPAPTATPSTPTPSSPDRPARPGLPSTGR
ncbi:PHP domain-containing protein [Tessaracoccus massiliensis]|uniref:PHP domain-containing protein n=1 Tax=Tessaracoccus massiliensis TaxID=1522311 RepID=UPI0006938F07|nr:PHP domain-containing protein [Tessaracoccus massiliensis]